jgi:glycosyltransferase involved in cell wall biosynthesis
MTPCNIVLCIDRLDAGGAERQFIELVRHLDKKKHKIHVIVFNPGGSFFKHLGTIAHITVHCLARKPFTGLPVFLFNLYRVLKKIKPDIIHGYMGGTNEICLLMGKIFQCKTVWGIRASNMDMSPGGLRYNIIFNSGALLSRYTDLIIVNSQAGKQFHTQKGYCEKKMQVIYNGIDHHCYYPDKHAGHRFREQWKIRQEAFVVGLVGRIDPMKGHAVFIQAAEMLSKKYQGMVFVFTGGYLDNVYYSKVVSLAKILPETQFVFTGMVSDMRQVYNALDISVSSSYGEGFSNTIAESMACGIPCVVTDVGDSPHIVGDTGHTIPPGSPQALAHAVESMMQWSEKQRELVGCRTRQRIIKHFSTQSLVKNTTAEFEKLSSCAE